MDGILQKIQSGEVNEQIKLAVARGLLPLAPYELVSALYYLCVKDRNLIADATETLHEVSEEVLTNFFEDKNLKAEILNFYLLNFPVPTRAKGAALLNPLLRASTLLKVSKSLEVSLIDLAVNNQVKILEEPGIIDELLENPGVSINQRQKLEEYKRILLKDIISPDEELAQKSIEQIQEEAIKDAKEFVSVFGKEAKKGTPEEEEGDPSADEKRRSVLQLIQQMSVPQKVQAAIKGDRELRNILVRDANKLVSSAVIHSPKITDAEIEFYANLRNVNTDVLRLIASNREWLKSYKVVLNLVKNPRTPLSYTTRLLNRIHKKDMRLLIKDRNVPEALRTMARKIAVDQEKKSR